jgi:phospholipid/cholesterol/gamma-HCH transport system substrate-binding protein
MAPISERGRQIRLGLFVVLSFVLLGVLIMMFGRTPAFLTTRDSYVVEFDNAPGLSPGTPIRRSGVKVGQVSRVELDEDGKVMVTLLVDRKYRPRRNEDAVIGQNVLSGDSTIDLVVNTDRKALLDIVPEGQTIPGRGPFDPRAALTQATGLLPSAQQSLDQIRSSFQKFEKVAPQIEDAARDFRDLTRAMREVVPEVRRAAESYRELADIARAAVPEARRTNDEIQLTARQWAAAGERVNIMLRTNEEKLVKTLDQLNDTLDRAKMVFNDENQKNFGQTLKNVKDASENLQAISKSAGETLKDGSDAFKRINKSLESVESIIENVRKATQPLGDRSGAIVQNIETTTVELQKVIGEFREVLRMVARGDGTAQRLLSDPSLYHNLNEGAVGIARLMPRIEKVLKDLEVFADKIARHPESLGVRGAIRPDSGLKDSPYQPQVRPR